MFNTFKGGIKPPLRKELTENCRLENIPIPQLSYIQLQQHPGNSPVPLVKEGDTVEEGQIIAAAQDICGSNIHSSVPGRIAAVIDSPSVYGQSRTIVIEAEGSFNRTGSGKVISEWRTKTREELTKKVRESGLCAMSGESFPSALTGMPPAVKSINTLIINATASEPYLTSEDMLTRTCPDEIIEGIEIALKILGIKNALLGIEHERADALRALDGALKNSGTSDKIQIRTIGGKYPAGAEKQIIYSLLKKTLPANKQPGETGIMVVGITTIYALREAVVLDKPLIERYITVSGEMINKPGNYKVRVGTRISDIVDECGGLKGTPARIITGGPMCGYTVESLDIPVLKSTSAVLFLSRNELRSDMYDICIRCGKCVRVCPARLVPCKMASAAEKGKADRTLKAELCIMCGSCSFICPANRPLTYFISRLNKLNEK